MLAGKHLDTEDQSNDQVHRGLMLSKGVKELQNGPRTLHIGLLSPKSSLVYNVIVSGETPHPWA